jgi:hypothetical protein
MQTPSFLSRLKGRLEAPGRGAATLSVTLRDFLIVTYAVPAERARPHVPAGLPLEMLPGPDGARLAFLQTTCFFNDNLHWSPLAGPGLSYHQSTYRILTRRGGRRGAFFLRTYLGTIAAHIAQRAVAREVDHASFTVHITGSPLEGHYDTYTVRAVGERGQTALDVRGLPAAPSLPPPFTRWEEMVFFLTQREEGYYDAAAGGIGLLPVEHAPLHPAPAELVAARLSLWTDLDLLAPEDLLQPVAVLIQPSIVFTSFPPRLVRLDAGR